MPRCTAGSPKTLHLKEATYNVPAGTQIWVAFARMQHNRTAWGPDHLAFRPSRFTNPSSPEAEQVQRRYFLPWSRGPRQCPGMKIAQIEFVAVIVTILSRARVECARLAGETVEMAAKRTMRAVRNSSQAVALQVNKPRDVVIVWKERLRSGNA
jgi:cytochrome P450